MRVIISGGTGLIGRALAADLAAAGHEVLVLSRNPDQARGLPPGVRAVAWDARTAAGWGHLVDGAGAIVNLAGSNLAGSGLIPARWTEKRKRTIRDSRLDAGRAIVDAVRGAAHKPDVVVQSSGVGYYGERGDEILDETAAPGRDFLARLAADEWEPSTAAVEEMGVRRVILRSGAVLDPREGALPRLVLPFRFFVGGPLGTGRQWLSWIHLADEVAAIRFVIDDPAACGVYNLSAPEPVTYARVARTLGRVLHRPSFFRVPGPILRLALGEVASVVLVGQRVVPRRLLEQGFRFRFSELEPALRDLL